MDDFEILDTLEENAKDEIVFKFTREIFFKELRGERSWRNKYDKLIDEYSKRR